MEELEHYLQISTYEYKIYSKFVKNNKEHILVKEFTPNGEESEFFILFKDGNHIFNESGILCANILNNEIKIIEP